MDAGFTASAGSWLDQLDAPVCPYTGLRTFTEDEAVYFRGREAHIGRCVELLATHHFLMITGASGDGKSSLVYAGLLPEIRAGFFRARYGNWAVCTFRPERQPLRQMARAVAEGLRLPGSGQAVENELSHGFSALVQLYQNSALVPPAPGPGQPAPPEDELRRQRRESANLLLIVDQFEEFFTNAENYAGEVPAPAAQAVVNLLLETTRLAREHNLPIYIVCTMRSDYIGQCADFRGLVELIGESQYFVPRLLRPEFVEIIREPALLSGNRIAERLVQRLVDDNRDGRDQLPVLQHALYRIWQAAGQGRQELDLLHYAMVGGLPPEDVPWADKRRFDQWRNTVDYAQQQRLLLHPSLHNVLDAHADQLYAEAAASYNRDFQPPLPAATAARVVEVTFRSLTKLDGQRVVRNRLTGAEITAILNDPALPWPVVCRVLRPFRLPGNTFLSPFLAEGDDDHAVLPPDTVLDITHESLIRNWQRLAAWAQSEADDVRTVGQLADQAAAWQASGRARGYLLPIGPYTQFARWYARKQPSASWLAYYVADGSRAPLGLEAAEARRALLADYLAESRNRLRFSLLVARYGAARLLGWVLGPLLLLAALWGGWQWRQRQDDYVAATVLRDRLPQLTSPYVPVSDKADLLINAYRLRRFAYQPGLPDSMRYHFVPLLDALPADTLALDCELAMYDKATNVGYDSLQAENPLLRPLLLDLGRRLARADSLLPAAGPDSVRRRQQLAVRTGQAIMALTHYLAYTDPHPLLPGRPALLAHSAADNAPLVASKRQLLERLREYMRAEVATTTGPPPNPVSFWFCTQVLLGQGDFTPAQLAFLSQLNPLGPGPHRQFNRFYPGYGKDALFELGPGRRGLGFQTYMAITAALHRPDAATQLLACADSLDNYTEHCENYSKNVIGPVLPYLLKYPAAWRGADRLLQRRYSVAGEDFSALVFNLLSAAPAANPTKIALAAEQSTSTSMADLVYADRASYAIPLSTRDKGWAAVARLRPFMQRKNLFGASEKLDTSSNRLFLSAFIAKFKGSYLCELKRDYQAGSQCFQTFDDCVAHLQQAGVRHRVSRAEWNGEGYYGPLDALDFLYHPGRPATVSWLPGSDFVRGSYYLPALTRFYEHQLRGLNKLTPAGLHRVRWLDSVVFREAALPGRYVLPHWDTVLKNRMQCPDEPQADLRWVRDLRLVHRVPGDADRPQRIDFLLKALQIPRSLTPILGVGYGLEHDIQPFSRTWAQQPRYVSEPLQVVLSNLTVAAAANKRIDEALRIARLLPDSVMRSATGIRIAEQAMLNESNDNLDGLDNFLRNYGSAIQRHPDQMPVNLVAVLSWRGGEFAEWAELLIKEGSATAVETGIGAAGLGRTLAGHSYAAARAVPAYVSEQRRQRCYNLILAGLAHSTQPDAPGWQQYDEAMLKTPREYAL